MDELEKSTTYKKFFDIKNTIKNDKEFNFLVKIYKKCIDKKFDLFYRDDDDSNVKLKRVSKKLSDIDINLWENLKSDGKKKSKKKKNKIENKIFELKQNK